MARLAAGKPGSRKALAYTAEQEATLASMKLDGLPEGRHAARAEFVNRVLRPDGSIGDLAEMRAAAQEEVTTILSSGATDSASLQKAMDASRKLEEIDAMAAQNRFLFVVDENHLPVIYFQCAVPGNPDVYPEAAGNPPAAPTP